MPISDADPLSVTCPADGCPAGPGQYCRNYRGKHCAPHGLRVKAAAKAAKATRDAPAKVPPIDDLILAMVEWTLAWRGVERAGDHEAAAEALERLRAAADAVLDRAPRAAKGGA